MPAQIPLAGLPVSVRIVQVDAFSRSGPAAEFHHNVSGFFFQLVSFQESPIRRDSFGRSNDGQINRLFFCRHSGGAGGPLTMLREMEKMVAIRVLQREGKRGPMEDQDFKDRKMSPQIDYPEKASRLGPLTILNGDFGGEDNLIIEGKFQGTINLPGKTLIIEKSARLEAQVCAHNIFISGELSGNVSASGKVTVLAAGRVMGDISASKISVADGSQFKGKIKIQAPGV